MASQVKLDNLVIDESFHERVELNPDALQRYAELYAKRNGKGPALKVQKGTRKIIDGLHRYHAAKEVGIEKLYIEYVDVPDKDLRAKAYEFNKAHGIPYSTAERNEVIWKLRRVDGWTETDIGKLTNLTQPRVSQIVTLLDANKGYDPDKALTGKDAQPAIIRRILAGETKREIILL